MKKVSENVMRSVNGGAALKCGVCKKIFYGTWNIGWHATFGCGKQGIWYKVF